MKPNTTAINPPTAVHEVTQHMSTPAPEANGSNRNDPPVYASYLIDKLPRDGNVLEICADEGFLTKALASVIPKLVPIDPSMHQLARLRAAFVDAGIPPLHLGPIVASATKMPFLPETFNAVVSHERFSQIIDLRAALEECHRVLTPGGIFLPVVLTPEDVSWQRGERLDGSSAAYHGIRYHVLTRRQLVAMCHEFFKLEDIHTSLRWEARPEDGFGAAKAVRVANAYFFRKAA